MMNALREGGYLDTLWESEVVWELRMDWLRDVCNDLSLAWSSQLSMDIRDKLVISYDKIDELRYMLSHHRVGKQLRPRPWVTNPWDGSRVNFPQPIRPRAGVLGWARLVKAAQERHGLSMDRQGKIAQRSYAKTVALQVERDEARGILKPLTTDAPLISVLGADGTGVA